ncbi:hypothetical protein [Saliphagus infecundisoli]|uniref:DUF2178 domain-containing protein n=1 Tax=Saliphagus infecundisoli TaxID=1849069 RepID=A0ABD5QMY8_9EURY|nr:hypothetical protein [Saliphagus infecundisoli]
MEKAVIAGLAIGAVVGGVLYLAFGSSWHLVAAATALYAGLGYFAIRYQRLLAREFPAFDRRSDRRGYAIGLFGACIASAAIERRYAAGDATLEFVVVYVGVVGFLVASSAAAADLDVGAQ